MVPGGHPARAAVLAGLVSWLDARSATSTHRVVGHESPAVGYSSETILVDIARSEAGEVQYERLVLKLPPSGPAIFDRYDFPMQARVQETAAAAGIPAVVPATTEIDTRWLGAPFLVMPAIEGQIVGEVPALDRRLTAADPADCAAFHARFLDLVADINRIDWRAGGLDRVVSRRDNAAELAYWSSYLGWYADGADLVPALTEALAWCVAHRPAEEPSPSLLWGDVRMENVIVDEHWEPVAVLDWEMATIGSAEHDLAWVLSLQATQDALVRRTVPGFLDHDACVRRYEARLGRPVQDLAWYEVFAAVRSTAILSRIAHLDDQRGAPSFFPVADNPILDLLARRIDAATTGG